jgi:hypothetical protein
MTLNKNPVADVLLAAALLIEPEGAWTQGAFNRDADGETGDDLVVDTPVCWCALGAVAHVLRHDAAQPWSGAALEAELAIVALLDNSDVPAFNDTPGRTQSEVVAKLREAAALAKGTA